MSDTGKLYESLSVMSDKELVAYWNIMQFPGLKVGANRDELHKPVVSSLLTERGISHEDGRMTA